MAIEKVPDGHLLEKIEVGDEDLNTLLHLPERGLREETYTLVAAQEVLSPITSNHSTGVARMMTYLHETHTLSSVPGVVRKVGLLHDIGRNIEPIREIVRVL